MALDEVEQKENVHHSIHLVAGMACGGHKGASGSSPSGRAPNSSQPSSPARP